MARVFMGAVVMAGITTVLGNQGCTSTTGIGDPCTPEQERDSDFAGFSEKEINIEDKSLQCATRVCLVNHFRGRVSCPNGQAADGSAAAGGCLVPGTNTPVVPARPAPLGACVAAQCADRPADDTVYCSCRCANADGKTDDGAVYCGCPDAFECLPLVASIGGTQEGLTGSYCVKRNTEYNPADACSEAVDGASNSRCAQ